MRKRVASAIAITAAVAITVAGCASGESSGDTAAGGTVKIGLITSLTGAVGSTYATALNGVKARAEAQNAAGGINGTKVEYVVADDKSSPDGALAAAKDLVQNQDVAAVISVSSFISGAQPFLLQQKVPVIGGNFSGNDWADSKNTNMFASSGSTSYSQAATTLPKYLQEHGVQKLGMVAFAGSASSTLVVQSVAKASGSIGLNVAYQNDNLPYGSTDVGAIAIGIKDAGVDGMYLPVTPPTAFALLAALDQIGVQLKSVLLPTGYGNDLLSQPTAVEAAQGVSFQTVFAPMELETDATKTVASNFSEYAGVETIPGFADYQAYVATDAYLRGLEANDGSSDKASFIENLRRVNDYTAGGLFTQPVDFSQFGTVAGGVGPGNCTYVVTLQGGAFVPDSAASPACGDIVE
jgi:branched-chain amino acid transport system substrate-binding protein